MRGPSAKHWAPVRVLERAAQACHLVGFTLAHVLAGWTLGGFANTSWRGAAVSADEVERSRGFEEWSVSEGELHSY